MWDLSSILSILILHFISFRIKKKASENDKDSLVPKAGHFRDDGYMPNLDENNRLGSILSSARTSFINLDAAGDQETSSSQDYTSPSQR